MSILQNFSSTIKLANFHKFHEFGLNLNFKSVYFHCTTLDTNSTYSWAVTNFFIFFYLFTQYVVYPYYDYETYKLIPELLWRNLKPKGISKFGSRIILKVISIFIFITIAQFLRAKLIIIFFMVMYYMLLWTIDFKLFII